MKKATIIALTLATVLASCKKKSETPSSAIIGRWNHDKDIDMVYMDDTYYLTDTAKFTGSGEYLQFDNNLTGIYHEKDISNNSYISTAFKYTLSGVNLIITVEGSPNPFTIKKQTDHSLILHETSTGTFSDKTERNEIDMYYSK